MILGAARTTKFAVQNFWRNLWLSVITVFLLVLTTFSITLVVSMNVITSQMINAVESKVDVDLYFAEYVQEKDILATQSFLNGMDEVSKVVYVSKEDALEDFRERHADEPAILASLDELDENVLPASLIVHATEIDDYPKIIDNVETSKYQEFIDQTDFNDNEEIIGKISDITSRAYQIGLIVSMVFIVISVIVIFNTIRITIYSHREEIGIMKLVGATNWFIRAPFIMEGILLGLIAAVVTLALFYVALFVSDPSVSAFFAGYDFSVFQYFKFHALQLVLAEVVGAILLSVVSSMVAITRYLRV
ncbi:MAG: permease-like cell division protein FtsX [Candidatus Kerfeldbacteria bacterium]